MPSAFDLSSLELGETDIAWRRRVSREVVDLEGPFRVAVIGEANTGTSAVVNSLLANPLGQPIVPEKIVTDIQPKIFKIGYGDQLEEFADSASGDVINIKCPADWLQRNKTEIYTFQDFEEHSDRLNNVLYQSELVILVTDTSRILSGSWESWFLKEFVAKGKQNIIVAVNGAGAALEEAVDVASKRLRSILPQPTVQSTTQPPSEGSTAAPTSPAPLRIPSVFPISTRSSTGLSDLRSTVIARLDTPSDRNAHKASATKFTAIRALERLLQKQAETNALLLSAKTESLTLANAVVAAEKRLVHDFQLRDLAVVQYGVTSFSDAIRTYFEKVKFWKLFWRSDFVAEDLKASMKEHSLLQAEYQMTYAVGRLNEGAHNLHELVRTYLANLQSSAHPFSNAPITQSIQKEATTVLDILNKKRAASALEVDPYVLRNEVASFDETKQCDALQRKAEKLVRNQLALQLVVYPVGLLFTHLGTPWAVSIPSTLFVSGLGLLWMRVRWGSFEEQFWTKISEAHKKLKNKLLTVYETRFTGVVAEPLASTIKILDDAVEQKIKDGEARRVEIEALINSLRR
ncbi:hypothetical protein HK097_000971 [Rhizophlyctis rosea]|uniref:Mmc1 C-terminal domain-containing protein n=1 Tax=Rhizophlyctis rosea TaxID=64517 RepID=A0AAD5SGA0_9FUNG|nr:hypothetical protein HK097_000971 [Rhizophlyctis rosea]